MTSLIMEEYQRSQSPQREIISVFLHLFHLALFSQNTLSLLSLRYGEILHVGRIKLMSLRFGFCVGDGKMDICK